MEFRAIDVIRNEDPHNFVTWKEGDVNDVDN